MHTGNSQLHVSLHALINKAGNVDQLSETLPFWKAAARPPSPKLLPRATSPRPWTTDGTVTRVGGGRGSKPRNLGVAFAGEMDPPLSLGDEADETGGGLAERLPEAASVTFDHASAMADDGPAVLPERAAELAPPPELTN